MSSSNRDVLARALGYPFDPPTYSYLYVHGRAAAFDPDMDLEERLPVIASGSNASPNRLMEKFSEEDFSPIPVETARLADYVAGYSAHFARYGSIPATLHPKAGRTADIHVTWLDRKQCERMHKTEAVGLNYGFFRLSGITLQTESGRQLSSAYAYISLRGSLHWQSEPLVLAELRQPEILRHYHREIAGHLTLEAFVVRLVGDPDYRRSAIQQLSDDAEMHPARGAERIL